MSTGDYKFLYKEEPPEKIDTKVLEGIWEAIYDEFIKEFGISEQYRMYLEKMGMYVQHLDAAINGGDKSQLTFAEIKRRQAEDMLKGNESKVSPYAVISKFMGFPCRPKEVTVKEFYSYLKLASTTKE
jgi:hypothetical protein